MRIKISATNGYMYINKFVIFKVRNNHGSEALDNGEPVCVSTELFLSKVLLSDETSVPRDGGDTV